MKTKVEEQGDGKWKVPSRSELAHLQVRGKYDFSE